MDDALAVYGANFKEMLLALAPTVFPVALLYGVAQVFYYRGFLDVFASTLTDRGARFDLPVDLLVAYALSGMLAFVYVVVRTFMDAGMYRSSPRLFTGERLGWREILRNGRAAFFPVLAVQMIVSVAAGTVGLVVVYATLGLGAFALAAAMIFVSMAAPAVGVEGADIMGSFSRSFGLVRGDFWRVTGLLVAIWLLSLQFESAMISPIAIREVVLALQEPEAMYHQISVGWKVFEGLLQALAVTVVLPFGQLALVSVYLDLRSRKEGMDLLMRAERLAPPAVPGS